MRNSQPLSITHPELAKQAYGWDPSTVMAGSKQSRPWICRNNHVWEARLDSRSSGSGCPVCRGIKVVQGENDLLTTHPQLAKQLLQIDPTTITAGSGKEVEWKCPIGHTYIMQVAVRVRAKGCPYCTNNSKRILVGYNDLKTLYPEIAEQLVGTDPTTIKPGSSREETWRCPLFHNHIWSATVNSRVRGNGCPICSRRKLLSGYNDLATTHPHLVSFADGWDPTQVMGTESAIFSWICPQGHSWKSKAFKHSATSPCPYCSLRKLLSGFNDLATTHPEIAAELQDADPTLLMYGSNKMQKWKCEKNHIYLASPASRCGEKRQGCQYCTGRKVLPGFNDLATTHPELAQELVIPDATSVSAGSEILGTWRCSDGHEYTAMIYTRKKGGGCYYCSGQKVLAGFNDLATTHPELAKRLVNINPTTVSIGSERIGEWICDLGHTTKCRIYSKPRSNCAICLGRIVLIGYNDLSTKFPDVAKWALGWDPSTVTPGMGTIKTWRCPLGHQFNRRIHDQVEYNSCAICSGHQVQSGVNDIGTTHPSIAKEIIDLDPTKYSEGSNRKAMWRCKLGHEWKATISSRCLRDTGCPYCSNRILLPGFNDLQTRFPEIASQAYGWDPSLVLPNSPVRKKWVCSAGHISIAKVRTRFQNRDSDCPSCAKFGFDPNLKAHVYLLFRQTDCALQIGITNFLPQRLKQHSRNNWEVRDIRGPMKGYLALEIEQNLLQYLDAHSVRRGKDAFKKKFDGYTESWLNIDFDIATLWGFLEVVDQWELQRND